MNISDFVKFDERSEKIINSIYEEKIKKLEDEYNDENNIVFQEKKYKLLDDKEQIINSLKERNIPTLHSNFIMQLAIEWSQLNNSDNFSKSLREINEEIYKRSNEDSYYRGDMLKEDSAYHDITLSEAKEMLVALNKGNNISQSLFSESLDLFKRMQEKRHMARVTNENNLEINEYRCTLRAGEMCVDIPTICFKELIARAKGINIDSMLPKDKIKTINEIKLDKIEYRWPSTDHMV